MHTYTTQRMHIFGCKNHFLYPMCLIWISYTLENAKHIHCPRCLFNMVKRNINLKYQYLQMEVWIFKKCDKAWAHWVHLQSRPDAAAMRDVWHQTSQVGGQDTIPKKKQLGYFLPNAYVLFCACHNFFLFQKITCPLNGRNVNSETGYVDDWLTYLDYVR